MPKVQICLVDPEVERVDRPGILWLISGLLGDTSATHDRVKAGADDGAIEAGICRDLGDATVLRVDFDGEAPQRVRIWKGISSGYEVFFSRLTNGDLLLADHLRNILALLPPEERQPSDEAVLDHFLFRHVRGRLTYSRAATRPEHGEMVEIDVQSGRVTRRLIDRLESSHDEKPKEHYIARVDQALGDVLEPLKSKKDAVNMLSGGVDSTLIQTYFGDQVSTLTVAPDSSSFGLGGGNAANVANLIGVEMEKVVVRGDEFLVQLEEAIDGRALPPNYPQWVTLTRVFDRPRAAFIVGERADALFARSGGRTPFLAQHFIKPPGSLLLPLLHLLPRRGKLRHFDLLRRQAEGFRQEPYSPQGYASQNSIYADLPLIERVFGKGAINERLAARMEYTLPRVEVLPPTADLYIRHLEAAQWRSFYNDHILLFRHLAFTFGNSLIAPFNTRPVVASALEVPPEDRYADGFESKYILKRLLQKRLPAYTPAGRMSDIVIPLKDYFQEGPLRDVWKRYDVPDMFTGKDRDRLLNHPSESTWNAVCFAIWRKRLASNPELKPIIGSTHMQWAYT